MSNMDKHLFTCFTCGTTHQSGIAKDVSSAAEWHNTNTGHDVSMIFAGDQPFVYVLTDSGWKNATKI